MPNWSHVGANRTVPNPASDFSFSPAIARMTCATHPDMFATSHVNFYSKRSYPCTTPPARLRALGSAMMSECEMGRRDVSYVADTRSRLVQWVQFSLTMGAIYVCTCSEVSTRFAPLCTFCRAVNCRGGVFVRENNMPAKNDVDPGRGLPVVFGARRCRKYVNLRAKLKHAHAGQQRGLLAIPGLG